MAETSFQSKMFQWHWNNFPHERGLLFHVNGKAKNRIEGNKFKAMGVVPGVSDLIYFRPGGKPLLIELKTETGTQQPNQKKWQSLVEANGYEYVIVRTEEEFKKIFNIY